jgi:hypothetical protein
MVQLFPEQTLREHRFHNCLKCMHEQKLMAVEPEEQLTTLMETKRAV